jgi:alpha-aminoadipate carrier protein LysW
MNVKCLECGCDFDVPDDVIVGEIVTCPDCGLELEVARIEAGKIELKSAKVEGEDWGE